MEKIWIFMILSAFALSMINGSIEIVTRTLFESTNTAIQICIGITGMICMWSGFMKIAEKSGFIKVLSKLLAPIVRMLFPDVMSDSETSGYIGMNIAANMLGLGNVSTPLGIKAMEKLQKENAKKERLSNSMLMFIVLNTASIQLIPTTVIALRTNYGSKNPVSIIIPTILSSIISVVVAIVIVKTMSKKEKK